MINLEQINQYRSKKQGRHDGSNCCSFCKMNKTAQQNLRRFIHGRDGRQVTKRIRKPIVVESEQTNNSMEWDWVRKL